MTMTDPVADMLTRLRNANSAHHDSVSLPSTKLKTHIAEILKQEGYIAGWEVERRSRRPDPHARRSSTARTASGRSPASSASRSPASASTRSRPRSPRVLGGLGVAILSTSSGLLTDRQAEQKGVGGEVLAYVW